MAARVVTPFSERLGKDSLGMKLIWAIPLVAVVVGCLYLGGVAIVAFLSAAAGLGAAEFVRTVTPQNQRFERSYKIWAGISGLAAASMPLATWFWPSVANLAILLLIVFVSHLYGGLIAPSRGFTVEIHRVRLPIAALDGAAFIGSALSCLAAVSLAPNGVWWLVLIALFNIASDTFSSVSGKAASWLFDRSFGPDRKKMFPPPFPRLSPGKTRIGFAAGSLATITAGIILANIYHNGLIGWLAVAISVAAPCGDLFGSALKRSLRIKDWSRLLGPHGGLNDRLDSFLFAAPAAYLVLLIGGVITL